MIRRFVNVVAENYKTGVYSLHHLDVSQHHLFHQSRADARAVPFLAEAQDNCCSAAGGGDEQPMLDRLQELPSAVTTWSSSNVDHFSLLGTRILCMNKVGTAFVYDPDSSSNFIMPRLKEFKGSPVPVSLSLSVAPAGVKEEEERLYIMHGGGPDNGLESNSNDHHFTVLRYAPRFCCPWSKIKIWHWRSLPVPPFADADDDPQHKPAVITAYTTVDDGGRTICVSSVAEGVRTGTYYFNTACCQWKRAGDGDWVLPFTGRAEYISDLELWLGFSLRSPGYLCAASGLSDMLMDHKPPMSLIAWHDDHTPKEWMAVSVKLLSLGSGKFAVVKVFRETGLFSERDTVEDEVLVLSGVELKLRGKDDDNNLQGLKLFQHKSICYICGNSTAIRYVL